MGGIGDELRKAREKLNISLQKVEEETNMRWRYLEALENEEWDKIPGEAYVKGFLRNYAAYLGLDPDEILLRYKTLRFHDIKIGEDEVKKVTTISQSGKQKTTFNKVLLGFFGLVIVFLISLSLLPNLSKTEKRMSKESPKQEQPAEKPPEKLPEKSPEKPPAKTIEGKAGATSPPELKSKGVFVELEIIKNTSWLQIENEKGVQWQGIARTGQKLSFAGEQYLKIWVGNGEAVKLKVNGQDLGIMGSTGEVVRKTFKTQ